MAANSVPLRHSPSVRGVNEKELGGGEFVFIFAASCGLRAVRQMR